MFRFTSSLDNVKKEIISENQAFTFKMPTSLPWQDACDTPLERLAYLKETGELADVTIVFPQEDITLMAHKLVLGMSSPVFKNLLYGSFSEASGNDSTITLPDDTSEVFKILLDHIYKGVVNIEDIVDAREVYAMAHKYQIKSLVSACYKYLKEAMKTENVLVIYDFAVFYEDAKLMKTCVSVINTSADKVILSDKFNNVSEASMKHLLNNDAIDVSSEVIMFKALLSWTRNKTKKLDKCGLPESESNSKVKEDVPGKIIEVKEESENRRDESSGNQSASTIIEVVKEDTGNSKDVLSGTSSKSTLISLTRQYLPLIRFLTMSTDEFCANVLPTDLLSGDDIKVVLKHIIDHKLVLPLPPVVSCSHRNKRSRYAPSAMLTCRLWVPNTLNKGITSSGYPGGLFGPKGAFGGNQHSGNGLVISELRANKPMLIGGIMFENKNFVTTKSILVFSDDHRGEFARVKCDIWNFPKFKFETPMKIDANRNTMVKIIECVNLELSKFKIGPFSYQEGDLILNGNCIQDVNIDIYFWT